MASEVEDRLAAAVNGNGVNGNGVNSDEEEVDEERRRLVPVLRANGSLANTNGGEGLLSVTAAIDGRASRSRSSIVASLSRFLLKPTHPPLARTGCKVVASISDTSSSLRRRRGDSITSPARRRKSAGDPLEK